MFNFVEVIKISVHVVISTHQVFLWSAMGLSYFYHISWKCYYYMGWEYMCCCSLNREIILIRNCGLCQNESAAGMSWDAHKFDNCAVKPSSLLIVCNDFSPISVKYQTRQTRQDKRYIFRFRVCEYRAAPVILLYSFRWAPLQIFAIYQLLCCARTNLYEMLTFYHMNIFD